MKKIAPVPLRIIHARAPLRINDIGGWTDTWFAGRGKVLNIAVDPAVEVQVRVFERRGRDPRRVMIQAENFGCAFRMDPDFPRREPHGLLQFAVGSLPLDPRLSLEIRILSPVPAGISTGTSASVTVALLGALNVLRPKKRGWAGLARLAHRVETDKLGGQSGIQDQIAAAHGGISFIDMLDYPRARVTPVPASRRTLAELDRRLSLVYLGSPHRSSSMHDAVIAELEAGGSQIETIRRMTGIAAAARRAVASGDLEAYGEAMVRNNECQRQLAAGLISAAADAVTTVAKRHRALGWKVNGAGGEGGSLTVLAAADDLLRRRMIGAIEALGGGVRIIPTSLSPGGVAAWTVSE